jgi:hypothetical protein
VILRDGDGGEAMGDRDGCAEPALDLPENPFAAAVLIVSLRLENAIVRRDWPETQRRMDELRGLLDYGLDLLE